MMHTPLPEVPEWNEPKQARSRQRFALILDAAAALIAEQGIEAVTTNHIAERACVAIGSLYQFFPSKEAVVAALLDRYLRAMVTVFPTAVDESRSFAETVGGVVDGIMTFKAEHPAFSQLFGAMNAPTHHLLTQRMQGAITQRIAAMLKGYHPAMNDDQRARCALVGYGIVKGLVGMEDIEPGMLRSEITTALLGYVRAFLKREGIHDLEALE
ncbi:MAG: TetR/AcrR family transcriptional regulator [bacterium]|nr:TetR/AcrR family transcriptional regulator [bacterium]